MYCITLRVFTFFGCPKLVESLEFCRCAVCETRPLIPIRRPRGASWKYIRGLLPGWIRKNDQDVSLTPLLILEGQNVENPASIFDPSRLWGFLVSKRGNISGKLAQMIGLNTSIVSNISPISLSQSINQYRKCLHRDVASTVQTITIHKMQNSKQLLKIKQETHQQMR